MPCEKNSATKLGTFAQRKVPLPRRLDNGDNVLRSSTVPTQGHDLRGE